MFQAHFGKKTTVVFLVVGFAALTAAAVVLRGGWPEPSAPKAANGVVDLSQWHLNRDGIVPLNGQWEFYWRRLLTPADFRSVENPASVDMLAVPGLWKEQTTKAGVRLAGVGYGTYRLRITGLRPGREMGLHLMELGTSYRLWVDGKLLAANGKVGPDKSRSTPAYRPLTRFFTAQGPTAEIVVQVSNFSHAQGGFWSQATLGTAAQMRSQRFHGMLLLDVFLMCYLIIMMVYHFGLFLLRRHEPASLFLGLLCFLIAIRTGLTGEMPIIQAFPALKWDVQVALQRLPVYLSPPLFAAFVRRLYPEEVSRKLVGAWSLVTIPFVLSVITLPPRIFTSFATLWEIILVPGLLYLVFAVGKALRHNREGALIFFIGTLAVVSAGINDLLATDTVLHTPLLIDVGLLVFTVCDSIVLSIQLTKAESFTKERQRLQAIIGNLPCGVALVGRDGTLLYHNPVAEELLKYTLEDLPTVKVGFEQLFPDPKYRESILEQWNQICADTQQVNDRIVEVTCKDGQTRHLSLGLTFLDDGNVIIGFTDASQRVRDQELTRYLADHDFLTGLPNVKLLQERLAQDFARTQRSDGMLAVMFLDLDRFKDVNDTFGHQVGDKLLCEVALRLRAVLRESDTVGRIGGDEFCVLLPDITTRSDAATIAERIIQAFDRPCTVDGHEISIYPSVGLSVYPLDGDTPEELMKKADTAMYQVKKEGASGYRFSSEELAG